MIFLYFGADSIVRVCFCGINKLVTSLSFFKQKEKRTSPSSCRISNTNIDNNYLHVNYSKHDTKPLFQHNDDNKIIIYTTSLGIVRATKGDCLYLTNVFRTLMLKTEERDIVSEYYHKEFQKLFPNSLPPQVVIKSFPVGGRKEIENLIETGEINLLTKGIEKISYSLEKCKTCNGYGYLTCSVCLGSCRSRIIRIGNSREVNNLRCTQCKEGMVRCIECIDMISY